MFDSNSEEIRKYINVLEKNNRITVINESEEQKNLSKEEEFVEWFDKATEKMIKLIKKGYYPVDVINKIARQYAKAYNDNYDAFSFARDALDRRAWEMGLRYTDKTKDHTYTKIDKHNGNITKKVTECKTKTKKTKNSIIEEQYAEYLDEGIISSFLQQLFPAKLGKLTANFNFIKLFRAVNSDLLFNIMKRYSLKLKNNTFSINDVFTFMKNERNISLNYLTELFNKKLKNNKLLNNGKYESFKSIIPNEIELKKLIETIATSMIYTSGIVDSKENLYADLSPANYVKGSLEKEINLSKGIS